jgi:hypothetical protein
MLLKIDLPFEQQIIIVTTSDYDIRCTTQKHVL